MIYPQLKLFYRGGDNDVIYHDPPKRQESHHGAGEIVERTKAKLFSKQNSTIDNKGEDDEAKNESSQKSDTENKVSFRLTAYKLAKPENLSTKPDYISSKPVNLSSKPNNLTSKPDNLASKHDNPSAKPNFLTSKLDYLSSKPANPSSKPDNPSSKPNLLSQLCRKFELQETSSYHCRGQSNLIGGFSSSNVRSLVCFFETSLQNDQLQFSM